MIEYLYKVIRPLILILPKMSGYIKTFKDGDKNKSNNFMSFHIKIEDLTNIKLNALLVYDDRYIKTKIRTYGDKVYTNFCGLNVPEDDLVWESFTIISIDSLRVYKNKYYLQVYLVNCDYKTIDKRMIDYLGENYLETNED